jgi:hypothetical protein
MANTIKIKRALNSSSGAPTLAEGELAYNEYKQELYIGKSSSGIHTIGGKEAIQDEAAALITGGSHTGISATYTDGAAGAGVLALAVTSDPVITLGGDLSGSVTLTNLASGTLTATIGSNTVQKAMVNTDLITGQTALAANPDGTNDYVLIYDNSASAFKKIAAKYLGATTIGDLDNVGTGANTETAGNLMVADGDSWEGVAMSGDVLITSAGVTTIQANSVALGTDTTGNFVGVGAVAGTGLSGSLNAEGGTFTVTSNATEANTASTIVARDGSGDFAAGTITAALTGNVTGNVTGTSSIATTVTVADTTDTTCNVGLWESATGNLAPKSDGGLTYNAGTGTLTATAIVGPLTGNVTGDASGSSSSCTGNAATSTKWAATKTIGMTGDVVWTSAGFDGSGNVTATSAIQSDVVGATELGVTAGTATASKALVVDASKDINLGSGDITATNVTGTLQTAAQTNVTSVGDLNGLTIAASQTVSMGSNRITNVTDPTGDQDAATKAYVDAVKTGLDVKGSVRVATTANGTLASAFVNTQSVDGVTLATGDRVLIKNQTTGSENGIYTVNASGAPTRAVDFDSNSEVTGGAFTFVEEGTTNSDSGWVMSNNGAVTVGSTALAFVQFSGAGQITAGSGMTKSGNTLDVIGGTGITVAANSLTIDTAWPGQNTLVTLGTVTSGTWSANAIAVNKGGTGFTGYTAGDIVYASGATAMSKLNKGTAGQIMVMNGGATAPSWTNTLDGGTY